MVDKEGCAAEIVEVRGLKQVSDEGLIADLVRQVLKENPDQVASFKGGKGNGCQLAVRAGDGLFLREDA
jgi:aspartyl-tRNA(Asn)/glutamyl-tRNA(Gln) amidotransferase subunit B